MTRLLFGEPEGLHRFGGYGDAERQMLVYLPEYMDEESLYWDDSPVACLRAVYYEGDSLTHRDFLGALMGAGVARETVGDICVGKGSCDFFNYLALNAGLCLTDCVIESGCVRAAVRLDYRL